MHREFTQPERYTWERFGTGQAVRRTEDQRFITGDGRYTDDIVLPGAAILYFYRSPYPHGTVT
ncbi:MAG: hypothetical protein U5K38_07505 [Woeseiaceae bacterium]|nr:hypothetical protein [Woeseiaceae bacterium]